MQYKLASPSYLLYVPSLVPTCVSCDIKLFQAANGVHTSYETLIDLLDSIAQFLSRLGIYTRIPHTPAMDEMVMKIMVEILSTLALATKELKQERSGKSPRADGDT